MTKRPVRKAISMFNSEADERTFWETHDTSAFVDWSKARVAIFPNLKPSTETISLRLPAALLAEFKALANKRDVASVHTSGLLTRPERVSDGLRKFSYRGRPWKEASQKCVGLRARWRWL